jgi:hypothetical protein
MAQDASANSVQPPPVAAPAPQLAYGVVPILQLAQAKVGDDMIIACIKNSGNSYGLAADQIIYLRQQGLSSAVLTTMLNQPKPGVATAAPAMPAATTSSVGTVAPTATYVQPQPAATYYYSVPATTYYYYEPFCYPVYGCCPAVSLSFGWGGRWGGWHGGGFRSGGFHGGGFHGGWHR